MEIKKQKINEFRDLFPQFRSSINYPDSIIQYRFNMADLVLNKSRFGDLFYYAVHLYIAHYLVLYDRDNKDHESGSVSGIISGTSIDKVSVTYDTTNILNPNARFWNYTRYGQELYQLMMLIGAGGKQILSRDNRGNIWR